MNEFFLHYLWKFRLFNAELKTTDGEMLAILNPGAENHDGGPDFSNAMVRIGNTTWAGHVEIHIRASDWYHHRHQSDPAYRNVILHVVYENDMPVMRMGNGAIPTLVVERQFPEEIYTTYQYFLSNQRWIPCQKMISSISADHFLLWAPGMATERLLHKAELLGRIFTGSGRNWEETLYRWMAIAFGFRINATPCEWLARAIPYQVIQRHDRNSEELEALLYGTAGLLPGNNEDPYVIRLNRQFSRLREKYDIKPMDPSLWKFLRMRPGNFPSIRLSQFASFLQLWRGNLLSIIDLDTEDDVDRIGTIVASQYWDTHYTFGKISTERRKYFGQASQRLLLINGIVPFLFFYGNEKGEPVFREKALRMLESCPPEENCELRNWIRLGFSVDNALHSQALLQLRQFYCKEKRCLECRLGKQIMGKKTDPDLISVKSLQIEEQPNEKKA